MGHMRRNDQTLSETSILKRLLQAQSKIEDMGDKQATQTERLEKAQMRFQQGTTRDQQGWRNQQESMEEFEKMMELEFLDRTSKQEPAKTKHNSITFEEVEHPFSFSQPVTQRGQRSNMEPKLNFTSTMGHQHIEVEPGHHFTQGTMIPNSDNLKEIQKHQGSILPRPELAKALGESCKRIEERLKAIDGKGLYGNWDIQELSLVPDLILPHKFNMPEFDKFDGSSCPLAHLRMFVRAMTGHGEDDKLFIHCFQASLSGSAKRWYNQLNRTDVKSWKQLAQSFLQQYQHVMDMAPDRLSLQNLEKETHESFRQYAQRWRDLASQVQPPLTEKEVTTLFINTLPPPYFERLIGNATNNFSDLVLSGELIENAVRSGKLEGADKRRGEPVHMVHDWGQGSNSSSYPFQHHNTPSLQYLSTVENVHSPGQMSGKSRRERRNQRHQFTPIPLSYGELYPKLLQSNLITPGEASVLNIQGDKLPDWYDSNAHCEYHGGVKGHSIERCIPIKKAVQELIDTGALKFE